MISLGKESTGSAKGILVYNEIEKSALNEV